jgi:hypothetical protein
LLVDAMVDRTLRPIHRPCQGARLAPAREWRRSGDVLSAAMGDDDALRVTKMTHASTPPWR